MERAQIFVIDASVAVKWYVEEEGRDKAIEVRRDYVEGRIDLASPALMIYEVFNALRYHSGLSATDIARCVDSIMDMQIDLSLPSQDTNNLAAELAFEEEISGYDAHYIALAQTIQTQLITSDAQLRDRLSDKTRNSLRLLKDYA